MKELIANQLWIPDPGQSAPTDISQSGATLLFAPWPEQRSPSDCRTLELGLPARILQPAAAGPWRKSPQQLLKSSWLSLSHS